MMAGVNVDDLLKRLDAETGPAPKNISAADVLARMESELRGDRMPEGARILATTNDGGQVYEKQDGTRGFVGPSMSSENPDTVARIMEGATPAEAYRSGVNQDIISQHPVAARAVKFNEGVPFVGEYTDEALGAVLGPQAESAIRAASSAMQEEHPYQSTGLQLAGGIVGSAPLVAAGGPAVAANAPRSLTAKVAVGAPLATATGSMEGAVSGYGRGTDPEGRRRQASQGAVMGGAVGGALGAAAPIAASGIKNFAKWVRSGDVRQVARELGISSDAAAIIRKALEDDDMAKSATRLSQVGDNAMLADASDAAGYMLDTAMTEGGKALRVGREAVDARAGVTTPQLRKAFDSILGVPKGTKTAARDIASKSSATRKAAYDAAYRSPIDYASDKGRAIEAVLDRVPPETLRAAVKEANEAMQEAGEKNLQILLDLDTGAFKEMPNVQQLDRLKRALGSVAEANKDQFGRLNDAGLRASRLARDLKRATGDAVPVYGRAVKLGGDKIAEDNALALGRSSLADNVNVEDVADVMRDASRDARSAYKQGLREAIEDQMSKVKAVISDPNADAREAQAIFKALSSRKTKDKIEAAIGKAAAKRIEVLMQQELPMLKTRAAVARGSQTASRLAGSRAIDDALTPGVVGEAARGKPVDAGKRLLQVVNGVTPQADAANRAEVLAEVAKTLTERRGKAAEKALAVIQKAQNGQPITEAEARLIANQIGGAAALGGYLTGKQSQTSQR